MGFTYFWLPWVFVAVCAFLSLWRLEATSTCGAWASHCGGSLVVEHGLNTHELQQLQRVGTAVVAHGHSCFRICGIFPDQGSNPGPLHWQVDSATGPPGKSKYKWVLISCDSSLCCLSVSYALINLSSFAGAWPRLGDRPVG